MDWEGKADRGGLESRVLWRLIVWTGREMQTEGGWRAERFGGCLCELGGNSRQRGAGDQSGVAADCVDWEGTAGRGELEISVVWRLIVWTGVGAADRKLNEGSFTLHNNPITA